MPRRERVLGAALVGALVLALVPARRGSAQSAAERIVPTNHFVLTGYGTVGYRYQTGGANDNAFTTTVNPILLFQFQDRVLFEAELEFELSEGVTETGLEYGQVDFIANDHLTLVGGKFLLPFGVFGERLHPTWINLFPTMPPIMGHGMSPFGEPIIPILSDVGLMARGVTTTGRWNIALNAYVTQGPGIEGGAPVVPDTVPEIHFPASSSDNNKGKMIGGRLDIALPPWAELNLSSFRATYDPQGSLDYTGWNVAGEVHANPFELRAEYVQTRQQFQTSTGVATIVRPGIYAQAAYRWGTWQPVIRWARAFDQKQAGQVVEEAKSQIGLGLDWWFSPSIAVMAGYELNRESGAKVDNDRFVVHFSYGF
jgi:hypothetical protein